MKINHRLIELRGFFTVVMDITRAYLFERINAALARVAVIYLGAKRYTLGDSVEAVP